MNTLAPLPRATFREQIATALREAILAGSLAPGSVLTETMLATRFDVSRAPLREAITRLIEEGLLVSIPYTGTRVADLTIDDLEEIRSMRVTLERFAFEVAWSKRDAAFRHELLARHARLTRTIDAGDDAGSIQAELELHSLIYETSGHRLLQQAWRSLRGRLQLYWAAHHRAHGKRGPRRDAHDDYVTLALGDDLAAIHAEIDSHMKRGAERTRSFLTGHLPLGTRQRALHHEGGTPAEES